MTKNLPGGSLKTRLELTVYETFVLALPQILEGGDVGNRLIMYIHNYIR